MREKKGVNRNLIMGFFIFVLIIVVALAYILISNNSKSVIQSEINAAQTDEVLEEILVVTGWNETEDSVILTIYAQDNSVNSVKISLETSNETCIFEQAVNIGVGETQTLEVSKMECTDILNVFAEEPVAEDPVVEADQINEVCIDSDGLRNFYEKGVAYGRHQGDNGTEIKNWTDFCMGGSGAVDFTCKTNIYPDSDILDVRSDFYNCPEGCNNGSCLGPKPICTESDDGKDYYNNGTTTGVYWQNPGNGDPLSYFDFCSSCDNNTENCEYVSEYFCLDGGLIDLVEFDCPTGCLDGACEPICSDSDGGDDIFVQGTRTYYVEGYANYNIPEIDYCKNGDPKGFKIADSRYKVDSCIGSDCGIIEYICTSNPSVGHKGYACPSGCQNGRCLDLNPTWCNDSVDGGLNYDIKGTTMNEFTLETDFCYNEGTDVLAEYYCLNNFVEKINYNCPDGCQNGRCLDLNPTWCNDSDGGKNYFLQGTTMNEFTSETDFCFNGTNGLVEYYCFNNSVEQINYNCPVYNTSNDYSGGCSNGACLGNGQLPSLSFWKSIANFFKNLFG